MTRELNIDEGAWEPVPCSRCKKLTGHAPPLCTECRLINEVEEKLRGQKFTQTGQRVYFEDGTSEYIPGPLIPLDPLNESKE